MNFYLIGVDYRVADIKTREDILERKNEISNFFATRYPKSSLFVTCNRFEVSLLGDEYPQKEFISPNAYLLSGKTHIFKHALRLAVGLESQLKGERQILQQIGQWYKNIPFVLQDLWQKAYLDAEYVRNISGLNKISYDIAHIIYNDIKKNIPHKPLQGLIVGTGKIAELFAFWHPSSIELTFVGNKNKERASLLAIKARGKILSITELKEAIERMDFIVSATKSPHFILRQADIKGVVLRRKTPLYIYDLAIPRDIDPEVKNLTNVILKNMDDLKDNFESANLNIKDRLSLATYLVEERVDVYTRWYSAEPACI
ncbi:MAG: hypothetical protein AB1755_05530 [Candidatus Omnitrophota bacterium]